MNLELNYLELILIAYIVEPDVAHEFGPLFGEESDFELDVEPDDPPVIQPTVEAQEDTVDPAVLKRIPFSLMRNLLSKLKRR